MTKSDSEDESCDTLDMDDDAEDAEIDDEN